MNNSTKEGDDIASAVGHGRGHTIAFVKVPAAKGYNGRELFLTANNEEEGEEELLLIHMGNVSTVFDVAVEATRDRGSEDNESDDDSTVCPDHKPALTRDRVRRCVPPMLGTLLKADNNKTTRLPSH